MRKTLAIGTCLLGLALGAGCASEQPSLSVRSDQTDAQYVATFDRALFTQAGDGQVDLILISGAPGKDASVELPLQANHKQSVQQVVHMRVLWAPRKSIRIDSPSASNASIDWHVIAGATDHLSYTGSCWAKVDIDGDEAEVDLRNATITVRHVTGNVTDPLKRAKLEGSFVATRADSAVRTYMSELATLDQTSTTAMVRP